MLSFLLVGVALAVPTAAVATLLPPGSDQLTGTLSATGSYSFLVQKPGRPSRVLSALATAADALTAEDYPYVWGGGHGQAGVASVGVKGPGHNGKRRGYDCSGAVAAVLAGAGLWPAGQGVPNDAGVIRYLRQTGEIVPGAGSGLGEVTLYDDPGVHIFMNIDGRFFGTSDGAGGGDDNGGPGWLDDGAADAHNSKFRRYHFLPSVLKATTSAGYTVAFQFGSGLELPANLPTGTKLRVVYRMTSQGTIVAQSATPVGELNVAGRITRIGAGGASFTIKRNSGPTLRLPATGQLTQQLIDGNLGVGYAVAVTYITKPHVTVIALTVTAVPTTTTTTTTPTTTTPTTTTPTTTTTTTTPTTTTTTSASPSGGDGGSNGGQGL